MSIDVITVVVSCGFVMLVGAWLAVEAWLTWAWQRDVRRYRERTDARC